VLTRFPRMRVNFVHSGWSGDRVTGGAGGRIDLRLDRDVFAYSPTVITVMLGMNDGEYQPYDKGIFNTFAQGYRHILDRIKREAPLARVTLLEPSPYDDITRPPEFSGGYNSVLLSYGGLVRELAHARGLDVADLNAPVVALLKAASADSPSVAQRMIPDRVHPSPGVHLLMAEALLRAWEAPPVVSAVDIDGSTGTLKTAENTAVASIGRRRGVGDSGSRIPALEWTQTDQALPMPLERDDETIQVALRHSDFVDTLNQQILKVSDLPGGRYCLQIDGAPIGAFDATELATGINLSAMKTPMSSQAKTVLDLTYRRNHLRFARMMMVDNALKEFHPAKLRGALGALQSLELEVLSLQRAAALPKARRYRLEPLAPGRRPLK
jgi:lysophospholipase L1-like esterase